MRSRILIPALFMNLGLVVGQTPRTTVPIPKPIANMLMAIPEAKECINDKEFGGLDKNFEATSLKLNSNRAAVLVTGKNPYCACGATGNCLTYLFDLSNGQYRVILE